MNKLQTVMNVLAESSHFHPDKEEAMEIINQMMQAEPVAWRVWECRNRYVLYFNKHSADRSGEVQTPRTFAEPLFAAPQAVPAWLPIGSAPKDGTLVVLYSPNGPDDWPDSFKVTFDYFCEDYENWFHHSEAHEHYMAVGGSNACGPDAVCTGPSEKAPYTHWMPLPSAPKGAV